MNKGPAGISAPRSFCHYPAVLNSAGRIRVKIGLDQEIVKGVSRRHLRHYPGCLPSN
jgi:hypothetical protein